ncbi:MAG TPA: hypothetical protein VF000_12900, partial [Agromyces sp.]
MDVTTDGELLELDEAGIRLLVVAGSRRPPSADDALRGLVGDASGVPADDVELVHACAVCGARHGRVAI